MVVPLCQQRDACVFLSSDPSTTFSRHEGAVSRVVSFSVESLETWKGMRASFVQSCHSGSRWPVQEWPTRLLALSLVPVTPLLCPSAAASAASAPEPPEGGKSPQEVSSRSGPVESERARDSIRGDVDFCFSWQAHQLIFVYKFCQRFGVGARKSGAMFGLGPVTTGRGTKVVKPFPEHQMSQPLARRRRTTSPCRPLVVVVLMWHFTGMCLIQTTAVHAPSWVQCLCTELLENPHFETHVMN